MLDSLQFAAFSVISSIKLQEEGKVESAEERTEDCFVELRRHTTRIVNEAFAMHTTLADEGAAEEPFQVSIHGSGDSLVAPYSDLDREHAADISCQTMWDEFVAAVGYASLFPLTQDESMELLMQTSTSPEASPPVPALDDAQKELFTFALDVLWCSIYGVPIRVTPHLRVPDDHDEWKDLVLNLPVHMFSNQLQKNLAANMATLSSLYLE